MKWINETNLLDDKFYGLKLKELKRAAEKSATDKQLISVLLLHFCDAPRFSYKNLSQSSELITEFTEYCNDVADYSKIKKEFVNFLAETSYTSHIPLYDICRHIKTIAASYLINEGQGSPLSFSFKK